MSRDRQTLQDQLRERMLSGEPFTVIELSTHYRRQNPQLYDRLDGDHMINQLVKILRHAKQIPLAWPTDRACDSLFALIRGGGVWRANL